MPLMRVLLAIFGVLLVIAANAGAVTVTPANPRLQAWADHAKVPTVDGTIRLTAAPDGCPRGACAWPGIVYMAPTGMDQGEQRDTWLHELGHQFDYAMMTGPDRGAFRSITHDHRAWRSPPNSPHEQFAVAYQQCAEHRSIARQLPVFGDFKWTPTPAQHARACALIRRVADRA